MHTISPDRTKWTKLHENRHTISFGANYNRCLVNLVSHMPRKYQCDDSRNKFDRMFSTKAFQL